MLVACRVSVCATTTFKWYTVSLCLGEVKYMKTALRKIPNMGCC